MKNRALIIVGIAMVVAVSIGGYVFAQEAKTAKLDNIESNIIKEESSSRLSTNHCENSEEMIGIMEENGFEDMAKLMKDGNSEAMDDFMNNLSDEDYEKMIDLMKQNGYDGMSRMMKFFGKEEMINMHNSMMGNDRNGFQK